MVSKQCHKTEINLTMLVVSFILTYAHMRTDTAPLMVPPPPPPSVNTNFIPSYLSQKGSDSGPNIRYQSTERFPISFSERLVNSVLDTLEELTFSTCTFCTFTF